MVGKVYKRVVIYSLSYQHSMTLFVFWVNETLKISDNRLVTAVEGIHDDRIDQKDRQIRFLRVSKDPPNQFFLLKKVMEVKDVL